MNDPDFSQLRDPRFSKVSTRLAQHIEKKDLAGGLVLVAQRNHIVHLEAQGLADINTGRPLTIDAIFRIHSMTKAITSVAALILSERGQLDLESPVSNFLPELAELRVQEAEGTIPAETVPSIRDLMRHTSGFSYPLISNGPVERAYRNCDIMDSSGDLAAMVKKLADLPLLFSPGRGWAYGLSTDVLGRVIEVVSGSSLDLFFDREILAPLGMRDTGFSVPSEKIDRFPACYNSNGRGRLIETDPGSSASRYASRPTFLSGGGGLVASTADYFRFLQMLYCKGTYRDVRILREDSVRLLTTDQLPSEIPPIGFPGQPRPGFGFSLGLSICKGESTWDPSARIGEYGWGGAASTHYWVSPVDELTVILMQQTLPFSHLLEFSLKPLIYAALDS